MKSKLFALVAAVICSICDSRGGLEIRSTEVVKVGSVTSPTNGFTKRISHHRTRIDAGSYFSLIDMPAERQRLELYHWKKAYLRRPFETNALPEVEAHAINPSMRFGSLFFCRHFSD